MQWNSISDFVHMGGYGLYVWGSYGMTLAVMVAEALLARRRHARARAQLSLGSLEDRS
jgi:heme exporter protein D